MMLDIKNIMKNQNVILINQNLIPAIHQKKVNNHNLVHAKDYLRDLSHLLHVNLIHQIKMY